jgi:hypothetical protein
MVHNIPKSGTNLNDQDKKFGLLMGKRFFKIDSLVSVQKFRLSFPDQGACSPGAIQLSGVTEKR